MTRSSTALFLGILATILASFANAQTQPDDSLAESELKQASANKAVPTSSLAKTIDAFLVAYAAEVPEWRHKIILGQATADSTPPPGYQKAKAAIGGWFYFAPKTWNDLTTEQRRQVMRDRRFAPFLATLRDAADGKAAAPTLAMQEAAKEPPQPAPAPKSIGRAELLAKLRASRRPAVESFRFEISAEELVLPGRMVVIVGNPEHLQ